MILYPIIRASRIITACCLVNPTHQLQITAFTEIIGFSIPIFNEGLRLESYIIPIICDYQETLFLLYEYNKEKYHQIELISLILLLIFIYYK